MIKTWIENMLAKVGADSVLANDMAAAVLIALIAVVTFLVYGVLKKYLLKVIHRFIEGTSNKWDDALLEHKVFNCALRLVPLAFIYLCVERVSPAPDQYVMLKRILFASLVIVAAMSVAAFIKTASDIYHRDLQSSQRPIRPLFQSLHIVLYLVVGIFVVSILMGKSPWSLFGFMGGLTAVTMLVFKDTILGFVAGIQLGANDMVREGDWIEMPKYGADGDVIEVTVNTVKVRNFDNTITTIPTYAMISDSFKNWRGMSESAGRRIKRSISIDMNTVKFADDSMLDDFRKMDILKQYIDEKQKTIDADNADKKINLNATVVNGRRQTNLGIFRAYLLNYLRENPSIHKNMTFLVRHLQPTSQGLPIEIYVFSSDKNWVNYEGIQADIFDHILAAIPQFGLRVFQEPTGLDFRSLH